MTSFKLHEGEAVMAGKCVICGCECAAKIELESEQNGTH